MIWTLLWLGWVLVFVAIEIPALLNRTESDTFSEHWWRWIAWGRPATPGVKLRRLAAGAFALWLVIHLFSGGWI